MNMALGFLMIFTTLFLILLLSYTKDTQIQISKFRVSLPDRKPLHPKIIINECFGKSLQNLENTLKTFEDIINHKNEFDKLRIFPFQDMNMETFQRIVDSSVENDREKPTSLSSILEEFSPKLSQKWEFRPEIHSVKKYREELNMITDLIYNDQIKRFEGASIDLSALKGMRQNIFCMEILKSPVMNYLSYCVREILANAKNIDTNECNNIVKMVKEATHEYLSGKHNQKNLKNYEFCKILHEYYVSGE